MAQEFLSKYRLQFASQIDKNAGVPKSGADDSSRCQSPVAKAG
jgi:hypothetical protein